jgi:small subunit ribosomal protein S2
LDTPTQQQESALSVKDLLEAGAHFGHQKRRWNPKMQRFIFRQRGGLYIIDLAKTLEQTRKAVIFVDQIVSQKKSVLFVGTKKQAKTVIKECAEKCGEYYICERWLGGMLTNMPTIRRSIKTLEKIEHTITTGAEGLTKKEISLLTKQQEKLERNLSGIRGMKKLPGLLIVVDPSHEHIAVKEARKLGIPVLALVDTNCDPDMVDHVIPCNDDALKSIKLIVQSLTQAIIDRKNDMMFRDGESLEEMKAGEDKE